MPALASICHHLDRTFWPNSYSGPSTWPFDDLLASTLLQMASRRLHDGVKWPQFGPETASRCHEIGSKWSHTAFVNPSTACLATCLLKVASKRPQVGQMVAPSAPKWAPKCIPRPPVSAKNHQKTKGKPTILKNRVLSIVLALRRPSWPQRGSKWA